MPTNDGSLRNYALSHDLMSMAGAPAVYHCHHFNLFLDQTIDDALGNTDGRKLRFAAAREASHDFLRGLFARLRPTTPAEKIQLATETIAKMGHGRLSISADANGGTAVGEFLHYGYGWAQKYGHRVRCRTPQDAFAAGFAAAALEVTFDLPPSVEAAETQCVAMRAPQCQFSLTKGAPAPRQTSLLASDVLRFARPAFDGQDEQQIATIAKGLRDFTGQVGGDERGLVQAFGVFVTMHLACYYNRIAYGALGELEKRAPTSVPVLESLLRESGHVCVFNTFGGILLSPEWEGMVGRPKTPREVVVGALAIARALGFGHWTLEDFAPNERLVVRAPATYESVYFLARHGKAARPNEYFLQGAVLAIAQLAHRVKWNEKVELTQEFYDSLFHGVVPWKAEQSKATTLGHEYSEVVVTKVA